MRKWAAFLLIAAGIGTMLFPFVYREVSSYQEQQLLQKWEAIASGQGEKADTVGVKNVPSWKTAKESYAKLTDIFRNGRANEEDYQPVDVEYGDLLGVIKIERIDCRLPILEGATRENMRAAAGHVMGTAPLGAVGNSAIAAHRSYEYGRNFNRLTEVEAGDKVVIETRQKTYTYTVYQILFVKPDNLSVLKGNGDEHILTLITCHPLGDPTGRWIVQAKLTAEKMRG